LCDADASIQANLDQCTGISQIIALSHVFSCVVRDSRLRDAADCIRANLDQCTGTSQVIVLSHVFSCVVRDSRLRDAADCIQANLDQCKGTTEREQVLQRLIDKEKTLQTVEYFCKHLAGNGI